MAEALLDDIVKKKTFKGLAGYSVKVLQGLLQPSRIGWETHARAAEAHGGAAVVLDVLIRFVADADLLKLGLSALKSIALATNRATPATTQLSVQLLAAVWAQGAPGGARAAAADAAELAGVLLDVLEFLQLLARRTGGAVTLADCADLWRVLAELLDRVAAGWGAGGAASFLCGSAFRLLFAAALSREGAAALVARPPLISAAIATGCQLLGGGSGGSGGADTRAALDPLLRTVDRLSRLQDGAACLEDIGASQKMLPILDAWLHAPPAAAAAAPSTSAPLGSPGGSAATGAATQQQQQQQQQPSLFSSTATVELASRLASDDPALQALVTGGGAAGARVLARVCDAPGRVAGLARGKSGGSVVEAVVAGVAGSVAALWREGAAGGEVEGASSAAFPLLCVLVRLAEGGPGVGLAGPTAVLRAGGLRACLAAVEAGVCAGPMEASKAPLVGPAVASASLRLLYALCSVAGLWVTSDSGAGLASSGDCDGLTVAECALSLQCSSDAASSALEARFEALGLPRPADAAAPYLLQLLAAAAAAGAAASSSSTLVTQVPANAASLTSAFFALSILEEVAAAVTAAATADAASGPAAALSPLMHCCVSLDAAGSPPLLRPAALPAIRAHVVYALRGLSGTLLAAPSDENPGAALWLSLVAGEASHLRWVVRGACTLAVRIATLSAASSESVSALLAAGAATPVVELLQGRVLVVGDAPAGSASPGKSVSQRAPVQHLSRGGHGGSSVDAEASSRLLAAAQSPGRSSRRVISGSGGRGGAGTRRLSINSLLQLQGASAAAAAGLSRGSPVRGGRQDAASGVGPSVMATSWIVSVLAEQPTAFATGGGGSAAAGVTVVRRTAVHHPAVLAADALYLATSLMAFIVAHGGGGGGSGACSLEDRVVAALQPVAAAADEDFGGHSSHYHGSSRTDGGAAVAAGAVTALLQSSLVAYSSFTSDAAVYANFKDMVDAAGVAAEDAIAALDIVRGAAALLRGAVLSAPTRSAAAMGGVNGTAQAVLRSLDACIAAPGGTADLEHGAAGAAFVAEAVAAGDAHIRARLPQTAAGIGGTGGGVATDYLRFSLGVLAVLRRALLLLEAVTLSPFLAWAVAAANGTQPLLQVTAVLAAALASHADLDAPRVCTAAGAHASAATDLLRLLAARLDDVAGHAFTVLAHLGRVSYETRASGAWAVEWEDADAVSIPRRSGVDRGVLVDAVYGRELVGLAAASVEAVIAAGAAASDAAAPEMTRGAAALLSWLAAASTLVPIAPDPAAFDSAHPHAPGPYTTMIISAELVEASVALLRAAVSAVLRQHHQHHSSSTSATDDAAALVHSGGSDDAWETAALVLSALHHVSASPAGAHAIVTRGASRQMLRVLPFLVSAASAGGEGAASSAGAAYRCLASLLRVLYSCCCAGYDPSGGSGGISAVLHKQGVVDAMVTVVFSPVGITSAGGASGAGAAATTDGAAPAFSEYGEGAARVEEDAWRGIGADVGSRGATAASGAAARLGSHTMLELPAAMLLPAAASAAAAGGEAVSGSHDLADAGAASGSNSSSGSGAVAAAATLLGALRLMGVLIASDAGRRCGLELGASALAAAVDVARSALAACASAAAITDAASAALSALAAASATAAGDGGKPAAAPPLPAALVSAASAALGAPGRSLRELAWALPTAAQVARLCVGVLAEQAAAIGGAGARAAAGAAAAGEEALAEYALPPLDALTGCTDASWLVAGLSDAAGVMTSIVDMAAGPVLPTLAAAAAGRLAAAAAASGPSSGGGGRAAASQSSQAQAAAAATPISPALLMPRSTAVLVEAAATLATAVSATRACADAVPTACGGTGIDVIVAALGRCSGGGGGSGGSGAAAADAGAGVSDAARGSGSPASGGAVATLGSLEAACHLLVVLQAVAFTSPGVLPVLSVAGAPVAVLHSLDDVLRAAAAAISGGSGGGAGGESGGGGGSSGADFASSTVVLRGAGAAFAVLAAAVSTSAAECDDLLAGGLLSFAQTAAGLCGGGSSSSGGGDDLHAAVSLAPQPLLLQSLALLAARLATVHGGTSTAPAAAGSDGSAADDEDSVLGESARSLALAAAAAFAGGGSAYTSAGSAALAVCHMILSLGIHAPGLVLPGFAARTVGALRAVELCPRLITATRRAMSAAGAAGGAAAALVVPAGRRVIALLTDDDDAAADAAAVAAAPADELLDALNAAYALLESGLHAFALRPGSLPYEHPEPPAGVADAVAAAGGTLEACVDALRRLTLAAVPRFLLPGEAADPDVTPSAATAWGVFATCRAYLVATAALLCTPPGGEGIPGPAHASISLLHDITAACLPLLARLAAHAEGRRAALLSQYWAGAAADWQLDATLDVPLALALPPLCAALAQLAEPAEAAAAARSSAGSAAGGSGGGGSALSSLSAAGGGGGGALSSSSASTTWVLDPSRAACVLAAADAVRRFAAGCGPEGIVALVQTGALDSLARVGRALSVLRGVGGAGVGGGPASATADACIAAVDSGIRGTLDQAEAELRVYTQQAAGSAAADDSSVRDVSALFPPPVLFALLRAAAGLDLASEAAAAALSAAAAGSAGSGSGGGSGPAPRPPSTGRKGKGPAAAAAAGADFSLLTAAAAAGSSSAAAVPSLLRAVLAGKAGRAALQAVLGEAGSGVLAPLAAPMACLDSSGSAAAAVTVRAYHGLLTAVLAPPAEGSGGPQAEAALLPAVAPVVRGALGGVVAGLGTVLGGRIAEGIRGSLLEATYGGGPVVGSGGGGPAAVLAAHPLWTTRPHGGQLLPEGGGDELETL